jgi:AcrR family transcriptional regulator
VRLRTDRLYVSYQQSVCNCKVAVRRTQTERSAATRKALLTAARELWGERGYANVGTPEIAEAAGVTRGAMYHQYADKEALLRAVVELLEQEIMERLQAAVAAARPASPAAAVHVAADAWLDISTEAEIRQLMLLDAPSVLGWAGYRELSQRYGQGLAEELLRTAIAAGELAEQPVHALATVLIGALEEAAMSIAWAEDQAQAREDMRVVIHNLLGALLRQKPDE